VNTLSTVRTWLAAVLLFGLAGTIVELLLLEHYEDGWQFVPLFLIVVALGVLIWHRARPTAANVRALQALMALFVMAGPIGVGLHFRGAAEFQLEIDRSQPGWDVFKKAMIAKAPPVLAPGIMMLLGLIGLVYSYRHPALTSSASASREME
jgi:hypothetical protein